MRYGPAPAGLPAWAARRVGGPPPPVARGGALKAAGPTTDAKTMRLVLLASCVLLALGALAGREYAADVMRGYAMRVSERGDPDAAHAWLDRAAWLGGETEGNRWIRGDVLLAQGDSAAALAAYDSVLDDPDDPDEWRGAWATRARLALAMDADTTGMAADLDTALRTCRTPYTRITRAFYRTRAGQHERALDEFNEAEKLVRTPDRTDAQLYVERGRTHARLDRADEAAADFAAAVRLAPGWGYAHVARGLFHMRREEFAEAHTSWAALADLHPDGLIDQQSAAGSAYCLGDAAGVRFYLDRFVAAGGDLGEIHEPTRAVYDGADPAEGACDGLFDGEDG